MMSDEIKLECSNKLISHLGNYGFRFIEKNKTVSDDTKSNINKNIASSVIANALYGLVFGPFSLNIPSSEDTLYKDLSSLSACGVVAGYKKKFGGSYLATIFDTSNLSDESIIGRFTIIYENLIPFQDCWRNDLTLGCLLVNKDHQNQTHILSIFYQLLSLHQLHLKPYQFHFEYQP